MVNKVFDLLCNKFIRFNCFHLKLDEGVNTNMTFLSISVYRLMESHPPATHEYQQFAQKFQDTMGILDAIEVVSI